MRFKAGVCLFFQNRELRFQHLRETLQEITRVHRSTRVDVQQQYLSSPLRAAAQTARNAVAAVTRCIPAEKKMGRIEGGFGIRKKSLKLSGVGERWGNGRGGGRAGRRWADLFGERDFVEGSQEEDLKAGIWGGTGDGEQRKHCERRDRAQETQGGGGMSPLSEQYEKKEPAAPGRKATEIKGGGGSYGVGLPGFLYICLQKLAFSWHIVPGQHSVPKGRRGGSGRAGCPAQRARTQGGQRQHAPLRLCEAFC